jgi:hypothetical protein
MALKSITFPVCRIAGSTLALCALVPLAAQSTRAPTSHQTEWNSVPFTGCKADGQTGPVEAPNGRGRQVAIPAAAASRLAYYESKFGSGVLAPRGWHCFSTYGSNGSSLFVSPNPVSSAELFSQEWKGLDGPAIQISTVFGDTSGRFSVARTIARVFPAHWSFVRKVIAEGIEPASEFPFGPYPGDKLKYLTKEMVEFQTPANSNGMGTASWLLRNSDPISGVAILSGEEMNLTHLCVRLPPESVDLTPFIVREAERERRVQ